MWKFNIPNNRNKACRGQGCTVVSIQPKILAGQVEAQFREDFPNWHWDTLIKFVSQKDWKKVRQMGICTEDIEKQECTGNQMNQSSDGFEFHSDSETSAEDENQADVEEKKHIE